MAKSTKKTLLLAKIQTAAGTDASPTAAANAILLRNVTATPLSAEYVERALIRPYMGNSGQIPTTKYAQIEGEVELAGSGAAGTAPAWGPLLRACGFAETVTASTDVTYAPISGNFELLTLHYYLDGLFHKIVDARGTVSFDITAKGIPFMRFRFMGAYSPITDQSNPTGADYSAFMKPLGVNKTNTPTWSLDSYTGCLQALTFDVANQIEWRSYISCEGAEITNRQPTGNLVLQLPSITDLNWPSLVLTAAEKALSITHGTTAGNIVTVNLPKTQLTNPSYSDDNNLAMLNLDLNINPGQGNDEIEIVLT
ncbi:hypothetical protein ERD78_18860 [Allopusillimonas soli]|uniref:Phage tail protein n=1 Tax=Allopusillimonas soli TaxID=659016 RepID=A0A853FKG9_9BURK|nr:phage tail tube protein [Allopusillimonas soli]NYT38871.1 hypothetical protein [Allopusillimonas soli]TEA70130.1 hypothetical protein ERD78_18860 [Allopusillimonas soli]